MTKFVADNAVWLEKHRQGHRAKSRVKKFKLPRRSLYQTRERLRLGTVLWTSRLRSRPI